MNTLKKNILWIIYIAVISTLVVVSYMMGAFS